MVLIDTVSFKVDSSVDHLATDWEVSDTKDFSNIILSSYEDYTNKNGIIFSNNLSTNKKYYARARGLLSTGYTRWGNIDIFTVISEADITPQDILPSRVSIPMLSTYRINTTIGVYSLLQKNQEDPTPESNPAPSTTTTVPKDGTSSSSQSFDVAGTTVRSLLENTNQGSHDLTLFEIWAEGFETIGTAKHTATTWWVENKDGDVIWSKIKDSINLTRIEFNNTILKSDEVYRIKAVFHTDSNDVSQIGAITIVTGYCGEIEVTSYLDAVDAQVDQVLTLAWIPGIETINWEILSFEGNLINSVWSTTTATIQATVPKNTLKKNVNYILRINTNLEDCYKYIPFITSDTTGESPNDPVTPFLVYPTDISMYKDDSVDLYIENQVDEITFKNNNSDIFEYDDASSLIKAKKAGTGTMTIIAKKAGYVPNYVTIYVTVTEDYGSTAVNEKYINLSPATLEIAQGEKARVIATTNCEKLTCELMDDAVFVEHYGGNVFEVTGKTIGSSTIMILGYDSDGTTSSRILDIKITKGSLDPDEPEEPEEFVLDFYVDKQSISIGADGLKEPKGIGTINVVTNAMFWDVTNVTDSTVVTAEKSSSNTLRLIGVNGGTAKVTIAANNGNETLGEITIDVTTVKLNDATTFTPLELQTRTEINKDVTIEFTSNIESPDEYDLNYDTSLLALKYKGTDKITFNVKEGASDKTIPVTVIASKNESSSTIYSELITTFNIVVKKVAHAKETVILLPDPASDGNRYYIGVTYNNDIPSAPNPIEYYFYVNENVIGDNVNVSAPIWEDGTGTIINTILEETVNKDSTSKFCGFKKYKFAINTNKDDPNSTTGIDNSNHEFTIIASVTYDGDTHVETFTLKPTTQLYLNFTLSSKYINMNTSIEAGIYSNATSFEFRTSDENIAKLVDGDYTVDDGVGGTETKNGIHIVAGKPGKAKLTVVGKNEAGESTLLEQNVIVVDPSVTTNLEVTGLVEVIEGCSAPFTVTTDDDATVEYTIDDKYKTRITVDEGNRKIIGLICGEYVVSVSAARPNANPVYAEMGVIVYNGTEVPRDITATSENLTVASEESVETTFEVFKGTDVNFELIPNLGKVTITKTSDGAGSGRDSVKIDNETGTITIPTLTPTYDTYKLVYNAPLTTSTSNVVVRLTPVYQELDMNKKDINILVNKKALPTGATLVNNIGATMEPGQSYDQLITATRPATTQAEYTVTPEGPLTVSVTKISDTEDKLTINVNGIVEDNATLVVTMVTKYKGIVAETITNNETTIKSNVSITPTFDVANPATYEVRAEETVTGSITTSDHVTLETTLDPELGEITITKE